MLRLLLLFALSMPPALACRIDCDCEDRPTSYAINKGWKYKHPIIWNVFVCEGLGAVGFLMELGSTLTYAVGKSLQHQKINVAPKMVPLEEDK